MAKLCRRGFKAVPRVYIKCIKPHSILLGEWLLGKESCARYFSWWWTKWRAVGISSKPERPYPKGTKKQVYVPLGRCQWLMGPFQKYLFIWGFPDGSMVKNPPAKQETWFWSLGWEDSLEKEMATHSSILAWGTSHGQRSLADYSPWGH